MWNQDIQDNSSRFHLFQFVRIFPEVIMRKNIEALRFEQVPSLSSLSVGEGAHIYGVRGFSLKPLRFQNLGLTNYHVVIKKNSVNSVGVGYALVLKQSCMNSRLFYWRKLTSRVGRALKCNLVFHNANDTLI